MPKGGLTGIFQNCCDWVSAQATALYKNKDVQETWDVVVGNIFLNGRNLDDRKLGFTDMLPYTALATVGFALADGGMTSVIGPAIFFLLSHPVMGMGSALNEIRKDKGWVLPDLSRFGSDKIAGGLKSVWDACVGNSRLAERGLDTISFSDLSPYTKALTAGFAFSAAVTCGIGLAIPLSLLVFGAANVIAGQAYTSLTAHRDDQKKQPPSGGTNQPASP